MINIVVPSSIELSRKLFSSATLFPLVIKKIEPEVRGAIIACTGYDKPKVKENITRIVSVALDISSNKICVTKLKG